MEIFRSWRHRYFEVIFKITRLLWIFKIPMTSLQEYSKYQCHYEYSKYPCHILKNTRLLLNIQNTHDITSRIFQNTHDWSAFKYSHGVTLWIFKIPMTSLREYSKCLIWIFESCRHGYFENSWSDIIGLLNTHEVMSWLFMKWPHGQFEYSWGNLMRTSSVFWILRSWRHGYFEYSQANTMGIVNIHVMGILNMHELPSWEYSKLTPWVFWKFSDIGILNILEVTSLLWIFKKRRNFEWILKIPMPLWIFKIPMVSASE